MDLISGQLAEQSEEVAHVASLTAASVSHVRLGNGALQQVDARRNWLRDAAVLVLGVLLCCLWALEALHR
jgi:hypothetical protein